jgi:aminoglycoside 3-N-acetyltransferase
MHYGDPVTAPAAAGHFMQTRASLTRDLCRLGLLAGETVLLHASLRSLGWVCGGATSVVLALRDVLGPDGTLIVPAQSPDNRDPSRWKNPSVPELWWQAIRENLPAFDPAVTPAVAMGVIAEQVRTWPGATRSTHPQTSFAGVGRRAAELLAGHELDCQLGERSPLGALHRANARVLLLGTGYATFTGFHLAEYRLPDPPRRRSSCAVRNADGSRSWVTFEDIDLNDRDFERLGADFERACPAIRVGEVGAATSRLVPLPEAVAFAEGWFRQHRR